MQKGAWKKGRLGGIVKAGREGGRVERRKGRVGSVEMGSEERIWRRRGGKADRNIRR